MGGALQSRLIGAMNIEKNKDEGERPKGRTFQME